nr:hypothetical protein [Planctomycetota bacterium]
DRRGGGGRFGGGGGGGFRGGGRGRGRQDRGPRAPRKISLDAGTSKKDEKVDTSKMSPEELMQWKLDQLKKKLERPDAD